MLHLLALTLRMTSAAENGQKPVSGQKERGKWMFQRILVPLDGSLRAERALPLAARLARASRGNLILLRVVEDTSEESAVVSGAAPLAQQRMSAQHDEAQRYLTARASAKEVAGIPLTLMVRSGPIFSTIQAVAQTSHADLLVLCGQEDWWEPCSFLDGIAEQGLEYLPIPLLLLPVHGDALCGEKHPFTLLVAFEQARPEHALLEAAVALLIALAGREGGSQSLSPCSLRAFPLSSLAGNQPGEQAPSLARKPPADVFPQKSQNEHGVETSAERYAGDLLVLRMPLSQSARLPWRVMQKKERAGFPNGLPLLVVPPPRAREPGAEEKVSKIS